MLRRNGHNHRVVTDLQTTHAMPRHNAMNAGTVPHFRDNIPQNLRGRGVRRVLDRIHALATVMVTDRTDERCDGTTGVAASTVDQRGSIQGVLGNTGCNLCGHGILQ